MLLFLLIHQTVCHMAFMIMISIITNFIDTSARFVREELAAGMMQMILLPEEIRPVHIFILIQELIIKQKSIWYMATLDLITASQVMPPIRIMCGGSVP